MPSDSSPTILESFARLFTAPWETLRQFFRELLESDERVRHDDSLNAKVISLLTLPWRLLKGAFSFMAFAWSSTRSGIAFARGLPALVFFVGFFGAVILADLVYNEARMISANMSYYQFNLTNRPEHPEWAGMFARKLTEIKPDDPQPKFLLAQSMYRSGETTEAMDLMDYLARQNYAPAHQWLANLLVGDTNSETPLKNLKDAEGHLVQAIESIEETPDEEDAGRSRFQLARVYQKQADLAEDENSKLELLKKADLQFKQLFEGDDANLYYKIVALQPSAGVRLEINELDGNDPEKREQIRRYFGELIFQITRDAKKRFPDALIVWQSAVACLVELEDADEAIRVINMGMEASSERETRAALQKLASRVMLVEGQRLKDMNDPEQYAKRLELTCRAISFDIREKAAYVKLLDFIGGPNPGDGPGVVPINLDWLQRVAGNSKFGGLMYALTGLHKLSQGDIEGGKKRWKIGRQFDEKTPIYIYQLLDVAAALRTDKFDNLLDILSTAIELFPEDPTYYVARGVYLKKLERYEEAILDFNNVVELFPKRVAINQQLKLCYEKTGQTEKMLEQQRLIDEKLMALNDQERLASQALLERLEASGRQ